MLPVALAVEGLWKSSVEDGGAGRKGPPARGGWAEQKRKDGCPSCRVWLKSYCDVASDICCPWSRSDLDSDSGTKMN